MSFSFAEFTCPCSPHHLWSWERWSTTSHHQYSFCARGSGGGAGGCFLFVFSSLSFCCLWESNACMQVIMASGGGSYHQRRKTNAILHFHAFYTLIYINHIAIVFKFMQRTTLNCSGSCYKKKIMEIFLDKLLCIACSCRLLLFFKWKFLEVKVNQEINEIVHCIPNGLSVCSNIIYAYIPATTSITER